MLLYKKSSAKENNLLNLILGRAGTGKTGYIMNEIKRKMSEGETGMLLIVPEQYSHDAEKQLCTVCGDSLSLHAEALSFTRLFNNIISETGKTTKKMLDSPGQIIALYRALDSVQAGLKAFGMKKMRTEILERLLEAVKEFKSYNITPEMLENAAEMTSSPLTDKLSDLALIYSSYNSLLKIYGDDTAERLTILAECIGDSTAGYSGHIYFDGFTDFTAQEMRIIEELLIKGSNVTICLTCDENSHNPDETEEVFTIPLKTAAHLRRLAAKHRVPVSSKENKEYLTQSEDVPKQAPELINMEKHLFTDIPARYGKKCDAISIYSAISRYNECEYAAYEIIKLVKDGYRWRDIGVMTRNWDDYCGVCETVFDKYDIPYFSSGKSDILNKPPIALLDAALEIVTAGYEYKTVFKYIKSGLIDITRDECALLENYVIKWQVRGTLWNRKWTMSPGGYTSSHENNEEILIELNRIREKIVQPLIKLKENIKGETTANTKLIALNAFMEAVNLQKVLTTKSKDLKLRNEKRLSDEYKQIWDIILSSKEQMSLILGDEKINPIEFHKLFTLALSQNNIGVIPISIDRTPVGSMAMSRRRDIKCLILIGASDINLPYLSKQAGALCDNERKMLNNLGTELIAGQEERLSREMNMIYSTVTLPSDKLTVIYSTENGQRPSFIVKRLRDMYSITEEAIPPETYMAAAKLPYIELMQGINPLPDGSYVTIERQKQQLSRESAGLLYGDISSMSATNIDNYYSCPYRHFLASGLKLKAHKKAEFDALTAGNFIHFVLSGVLDEVKTYIGFVNIDESTARSITEKYINTFINDTLMNFDGKTERFKYLFERYRADVRFVVSDMLNELKNSSFEPLDLELDMSRLSKTQRGKIDRVDGYEHEGKLFLRVIDYKTKRAAYTLNMTDIFHGRDLQMLIYLFSLKKHGQDFYGKTIEPAGVLYVPARDVIISVPRDADEEGIEKIRKGEMKRNGLVLNNPIILEAMEKGDVKEYLPVKSNKDGDLTGNSLITSQQFELLSLHVDKMLQSAKENIKTGHNVCSPYFKSDNDNACNFCDYHTVCGFDEELGDKRRFIEKINDEDVWELLGN